MSKYEKKLSDGRIGRVIAVQVLKEFDERFIKFVKDKKAIAKHDERVNKTTIVISALEEYMAKH